MRRMAFLGMLVLAGCGGSHHASAPPSRAAFAVAADRVCAEAGGHGERLAGLRALRPPRQGADLYSHWLNAERDALRAAEDVRDPPSKVDLDPATALAIAEGKAAGYARRLGALECARTATGTLSP